jgi:quercetin dioxygenase-like cupin family protein
MTTKSLIAKAQFQSNHTSEVARVQQIAGGYRRVLADGDRVMLVEWRFEPGASVPEHSHPHEQCGYVISGEMLFTIGGVEREVPLGTGYLIPGNVPHSARFEEFTVLVDIFSPPREDYREQSADAPSYMMGTMPLRRESVPPSRSARAARSRVGQASTKSKPRAARGKSPSRARTSRGTSKRR